MKKTVINNIEDVNFGKLEIITMLNSGYDGETEDIDKRDVEITLTGFDKLNDNIKEKLIEELAGKVRIKVNAELKATPTVYDSESYAEMLDSKDCKLEFNVNELYTTQSRSLNPYEQMIASANAMFKDGKLTESKRDEIIELAKASMK